MLRRLPKPGFVARSITLPTLYILIQIRYQMSAPNKSFKLQLVDLDNVFEATRRGAAPDPLHNA